MRRSFFDLCSFSYLFCDPAPTEIYTLSLHDALPIWVLYKLSKPKEALDYLLKAIELSEEPDATVFDHLRSEEHTSELQSLRHLVCRLLLEKKKANMILEASFGNSCTQERFNGNAGQS